MRGYRKLVAAALAFVGLAGGALLLHGSYGEFSTALLAWLGLVAGANVVSKLAAGSAQKPGGAP